MAFNVDLKNSAGPYPDRVTELVPDVTIPPMVVVAVRNHTDGWIAFLASDPMTGVKAWECDSAITKLLEQCGMVQIIRHGE